MTKKPGRRSPKAEQDRQKLLWSLRHYRLGEPRNERIIAEARRTHELIYMTRKTDEIRRRT